MDQASQRQTAEVHLLNLRLPELQLSIWESGTWRTPSPKELPDRSVPIRIVHLWADWCPPCKAEFPRLKRIADELGRSYGKKDVRLMLISETDDAQLMARFLNENHGQMPVGEQYGDNQHHLMFSVLHALPEIQKPATLRIERTPGRELPLPITLVVDADNVVRLAFVGSLEGRYGQFANGVEQLYRTLKSQPSATPGRMVAGRPNGAQPN